MCPVTGRKETRGTVDEDSHAAPVHPDDIKAAENDTETPEHGGSHDAPPVVTAPHDTDDGVTRIADDTDDGVTRIADDTMAASPGSRTTPKTASPGSRMTPKTASPELDEDTDHGVTRTDEDTGDGVTGTVFTDTSLTEPEVADEDDDDDVKIVPTLLFCDDPLTGDR